MSDTGTTPVAEQRAARLTALREEHDRYSNNAAELERMAALLDQHFASDIAKAVIKRLRKDAVASIRASVESKARWEDLSVHAVVTENSKIGRAPDLRGTTLDGDALPPPPAGAVPA